MPLLDGGGAGSTTTLSKVDGAEVVRGRPVRSMSTYRRQLNYPGLLWTATTRSLVGSRESARAGPAVAGRLRPVGAVVASQPLWLSGAGGIRRHCRTFCSDGGRQLHGGRRPTSRSARRPGGRRGSGLDRDALRGEGAALRGVARRGPGVPTERPVLSGWRRLAFVDEATVVKVAEAGSAGMTLAQAEVSAKVDRAAARTAVLSLLWFGHWTIDMSRPLSSSSVLQTVQSAA